MSDVVGLEKHVNTMQNVAEDLACELSATHSKNSRLQTELNYVKHQAKAKEVNKQRVATLRLSLKNARKENACQKKHIDVLKCSIQRKSAEMKRLRSSLAYVETCKQRVKRENNNLVSEITNLKNEVDRLIEEFHNNGNDLNDSRQENDCLREIHDQIQLNEVQCFDHDGRVYTPALQSCVYSLLENHVSARQVSSVINSVLKMIGKTADRLPSSSTIHNMNLQRLSISQKQLADVTDGNENTSIYTDETSKYGTKVCGYHIRDAEGMFYTLGMRELTTKSGKDTLEVLKEILLDIDSAANDAGNGTSMEILKNIKSTMSDSASTEIKFNELLEEYRASILPYTVENYHHLDDNQKASICRLSNFFCGLHSLVHFAETSSKALTNVENEIFVNNVPIHDPSFKKANEPGTTRLIRTACKAFARGADEKSGCHIQFYTYIADFLKASNYRSLKLVPYRGNRFNILFHNAGQVFLLHHEMINFLKNYDLNRLTRSVLHDLQQPVFTAGCKALGLISKLISTPLWNILENKEVKILDMNKHYLELQTFVREACGNVSDFMAGNCPAFYGSVKEDAVYQSLISEGPYDTHCETILNVILPALCKYISKKFEDYLPGGKFSEVTEEDRQITESVEKHNKHCERVFAYYDQLLRFKPHISTLASEAYVMFCLNKTGDWLSGKSVDEIKEITEQARKYVKQIRQRFRERRKRIEQERAAKLEQTRLAREQLEAKRLQQLELNTKEIIYFGLWQTHEQVDRSLETLTTKSSKVDALKAQLRFRKDVLKQRTECQTVYNFSKVVEGKRSPLSVEELTNSVKPLLTHAFTLENPAQNSDNTQFLVQKRVKHKFKQDGVDTWFKGKVISQVPGFPKYFNVVYEGEEDPAVYSFKLLEDLEAGDLEIIV